MGSLLPDVNGDTGGSDSRLRVFITLCQEYSSSMTTEATRLTEQVVLLGEDGKPRGIADKAAVHGADTPLHLAFSVYLFDDQDRVLATRRALRKKTWPGVWTNSCCGHPAPGERIEDAVKRRVRFELGFEIDKVHPLLPEFGYRAIDDSGIVENELCPVYWARVPGSSPAPRLNPDEVASWAWTDLRALIAISAVSPFLLSPWAVLQLEQMVPTQDMVRSEAPKEKGAHRRTEMAPLTAFAEHVLDVVHRIPPGKVLTYADVAEYLGEGGSRAVGGVMARHGHLVPWWRVLRSGGLAPVGQESEAIEHYKAEGTPLTDNGTRVDLDKARWRG